MKFDFKTLFNVVAIIFLIVSAIGFFSNNYNLAWGFVALAAIAFLAGRLPIK